MIVRPPEDIALKCAELFLDMNVVEIAKGDDLFTFTSGIKSPVYVDAHRPISFVYERNIMLGHAEALLDKLEFDYLAGGETAGIPYAAFLAERFKKPMLYVRKKPKGFGRMAQIEGIFETEAKVILIEDLTTDGGSKIKFCDALRGAGAKVTDIFSLFYYDSFDYAEKDLSDAGVKLHYLTSWDYILKVAEQRGDINPQKISDIKEFLNDPQTWQKKLSATK